MAPNTKSEAAIPLTDLQRAHRECFAPWRARLPELVARSQWILGPEVSAFETEFAASMGAPFAVGTASGTDAITIALLLRGIDSPERSVMTSPLTAPFTAMAVLRAGARVRFCDIDAETLLLDPVRAAEVVTPDTAAFLPVHLYGQTCDLERWRNLAAATGAALIQDACQAHGARHEGKTLTAYSSCVAYSFYPTKNLGALGDGGALCLAAEEDLVRARELRDGGRRQGHVSHCEGLNSRLDEIQAAWLRIALTRLERWNATRRRLAAVYDEELAALPPELLRPVARSEGSGHVYHLYVARAARRDDLRERLATNGVSTGIHYPVPLHLQPAFASCGLRAGDLPVAEKAVAEIVSLPMGVHLSQEQARRVTRLIRAFYGC
ncbi:MAG: DegT/DnrJ/EryC1/StrS family aminotransferase [Bryobacteraceae bacterium]|nr:DegT/DnrJ/EryC1/StrS family aminotransferase [Bryobacteraceae bacterium]